nr:hypothetical protein [Tanacetum cinerariifolium]
MRFMLASRSAKAKHSSILGKLLEKSHGMRNLPGSPSFSGNFLRRTAEQCTFSEIQILEDLEKFLLLVISLIPELLVMKSRRIWNWRFLVRLRSTNGSFNRLNNGSNNGFRIRYLSFNLDNRRLDVFGQQTLNGRGKLRHENESIREANVEIQILEDLENFLHLVISLFVELLVIKGWTSLVLPLLVGGPVSFVTSVSRFTTLGGEKVVGIVGPLYAIPLQVVIPFKSSFGLVMVLLGSVPEPEDEACMRTRSSSNLVDESSPNPTTSNPKHRNHRRSKQPFILEESLIDTMANQRTTAELLLAPTKGYA